jgi:(p)ppGpp synthase/HD superfamily hydrolase
LRDEHPDPAARDPLVLALALLHDVLEDCDVTPEALALAFGPTVSACVRLLSRKLRTCAAATKSEPTYWAQIARAPRPVQLVKAADRLDNLRACVRHPIPHIVARYRQETPALLLPLLAGDPWMQAALEHELGRLPG